MRKDSFVVGHYVHAYNRGNRKQEIVRDDIDRRHFLQALYYLNSINTPSNPFQSLRSLQETQAFEPESLHWPPTWRPREPLVSILSFMLRDNHYHLLLKEIREGGISLFMQKLGTSITNRFNTRYEEVGRLFQGPYKARRVDVDNHLRYLPIYIVVKNAFESYPGGISRAMEQFPQAFQEAVRNPFSGLSILSKPNAPILESDELITAAFPDEAVFMAFAKETVRSVDFDEKAGSIDVSVDIEA